MVAEEEVETTSSDADDEVVTLEKVVVTGSRIKRTQEEGALPLLVITKKILTMQVLEMLQKHFNQYLQLMNILKMSH